MPARSSALLDTRVIIFGAAGTVITECASNSNGSHGITTGSGCTISRCTVRSNVGDGINVFSSCLVFNNACSINGNGAGDGAGIHALSADNRIEGNNCLGADRGIDVDAAGNIIVKNSASGNTTNYSIVANNVFGAIVVALLPPPRLSAEIARQVPPARPIRGRISLTELTES
jgi:parallel beta-helix repeat protein